MNEVFSELTVSALCADWAGEELLEQVPHRQIVLTIAKRLRIFFRYGRRLLGGLAACANEVQPRAFSKCYDAPERGVGMPIRVECYAGHRGEETPRRFEIGDLRVEVVEVVDRWLEPDYRYFRVKGGNGKIYLVRYNTTRDSWELTASKSSFH